MTEKYAKTTGERILEVMKKISSFSIDDKVDVLIDRFDEMVTETKNLTLAERLNYALSLQFVDRLDTGGKINSGEKIRLKDLLEDVDGNPRDGDTAENMKKELKRLKVAENCEEPFQKENKTYYTRNEDTRSRYNSWRNRSDSYKRSGSQPKYYRSDSNKRWIRDSSQYG